MKKMIIALTSLFSFNSIALADSTINCMTTGTSLGRPSQVSVEIVSKGDLGLQPVETRITAMGQSFTEFHGVASVKALSEDSLTLHFSTLSETEELKTIIDIQLAKEVTESGHSLTGAGIADVLQKGPSRLAPVYSLSECSGIL